MGLLGKDFDYSSFLVQQTCGAQRWHILETGNISCQSAMRFLQLSFNQKPEITFALESQNRLKPNHPEILLPQKDLSMDKLNKCRRYIGFTQEEWEYIEKQTKLCKMQSPSVFIRSCVEEYRKQKLCKIRRLGLSQIQPFF